MFDIILAVTVVGVLLEAYVISFGKARKLPLSLPNANNPDPLIEIEELTPEQIKEVERKVGHRA